MIKTDNRHYNNTKHQRMMRKQMDLWCKIGNTSIDLTEHYNSKIVEHNNNIIEVEHKGKVVDLDWDEESTTQDMYWKIDIQTEGGYILKDVFLPRPTCPDDLYKEICDIKAFIENKVQNNIGNFDWKQNYKKMMNEINKLIRVNQVKTFTLRNMMAKHNLQESFPVIWKKLN